MAFWTAAGPNGLEWQRLRRAGRGAAGWLRRHQPGRSRWDQQRMGRRRLEVQMLG